VAFVVDVVVVAAVVGMGDAADAVNKEGKEDRFALDKLAIEDGSMTVECKFA